MAGKLAGLLFETGDIPPRIESRGPAVRVSLGVSPRILTFSLTVVRPYGLTVHSNVLTFSLTVVRPYGLTVHSNPKPDLTRKPKTVQKNR